MEVPLNQQRIKKLQALANHPSTPKEEAKVAATLLEKAGISNKPPKQAKTKTRTSTKSSPSTKWHLLTLEEAAKLVFPWCPNDENWGILAGYRDSGYKYLIKDQDGTSYCPFRTYPDALRAARYIPKYRYEDGKNPHPENKHVSETNKRRRKALS